MINVPLLRESNFYDYRTCLRCNAPVMYAPRECPECGFRLAADLRLRVRAVLVALAGTFAGGLILGYVFF